MEEVLRLATPTADMRRLCTRDTELGGVALPKDAVAVLRFAAANRAPAVFPDPDRFDAARENAGEHLAFGRGIHRCLGAMLARPEMAVAFRTLLGRLHGWRLAADAPPPSPTSCSGGWPPSTWSSRPRRRAAA